MTKIVKLFAAALFFFFAVQVMFAQDETRHCVKAVTNGPLQALLDDGRPMSLLPFLQHENGDTIKPEEYRKLPDSCYYLPLDAQPDEKKFSQVLQEADAAPVVKVPLVLSPRAAASTLLAEAEASRLRDIVYRVTLQNSVLTAEKVASAKALGEKDGQLNTAMGDLGRCLDNQKEVADNQKWNISSWWLLPIALAFGSYVVFREKRISFLKSYLKMMDLKLQETRSERDVFERASALIELRVQRDLKSRDAVISGLKNDMQKAKSDRDTLEKVHEAFYQQTKRDWEDKDSLMARLRELDPDIRILRVPKRQIA